MLRKNIFMSIMPTILIVGIISLFAIPINCSAKTLSEYCSNVYFLKGKCPKKLCNLNCIDINVGRACALKCVPKECFQIDAKYCPEECQIMKGCDGKDICYDKIDEDPPECGGLAYAGESVACCKGFVKRCGIEFFDGSCDMEGSFSIDSIPICLPCGNGICNQFENRCNCPEDCKEKQ